MTPELEQQLTDFYNELAREDLAPDDPLYVPFVEQMPGGDPV